MINTYKEYIELKNRLTMIDNAQVGTAEYYELMEVIYLIEKYEEDVTPQKNMIDNA